MSSKKLGFVAGTAFVVMVTSGALAQSGAAVTCSTDYDCPSGQVCANQTEPGKPDLPSEEVVTQPARNALVAPAEDGSGTCEPAPEGSCESDADCEPGLGCVKSQSSPGCAAPSGAEIACDTAVYTSRYGWCEVKPVSCVVDADCPNGLSCVETSASSDLPATNNGGTTCDSDAPDCPVSTGGGASGSGGTTQQKAVEKFCGFKPQACESDSECQANYECAITEVKMCSGGATDDIACDSEAADCGARPAEPLHCEVEATEGYCMPRKMPCASDAECPSEYTCTELEAEQVPQSWNVTGDVQSCLPDGLALYAQYSARDLGGVLGEVHTEDGKGSADSDEERAQGGSGKGGDGSACSVNPTQSGSAWFAGFLALLGLALLRRSLVRREVCVRR